jgi:hypothetical protein
VLEQPVSSERFQSDAEAKKAVRRAFAEDICARYPLFTSWKGDDVPKIVTCMAWPGPPPRVFIALLFGKYDARFTVECGWTQTGRFPSDWSYYWRGIKKPDGSYGERAASDAARFRVSELEYPPIDLWWNPMGAKRSDRAKEAVHEALDYFSSVAMPFILQRTGLELP